MLGGRAPAEVPSGSGSGPRWHELLTRVEVLLATLREQVTEIEAREAEAPRSGRNATARQHLLGDIDAARSAVKHARGRVADFGSKDQSGAGAARSQG
jgi:hypothetical protein